MKNVTLNYPNNAPFQADPQTTQAHPGETIVFKRGSNVPSDHKLRITLVGAAEDLGHKFSTTRLQHGQNQNGSEDLHLQILPGFVTGAATVKFTCEILNAAGVPVVSSDPSSPVSVPNGGGGEIMPAT